MGTSITETFQKLRERGEKAFIPFITAGDPDLETTVRLVPAMAEAGADLVELGIPFSDPIADGPTIQRASERALGNGIRLADALEAVRRIRGLTSIPIVLFSYFNPLLQYGLERLARDAGSAGVDGVLVTDLAPEESGAYRAALSQHSLDPVFIAAPTSTPERIDQITRCSRGFVYLVSRTGVTGASERLTESIAPSVRLIRSYSELPVAVGFGISRPEHVEEVWTLADGAVVGSAIVDIIEQCRSSGEAVRRVRDFCSWMTGRSRG